ncbi:PAS domain S-box protein [Persicimonas caeni]|uniref:histidine kinase n=1 Tax=Persicimonas caeni TaxID=2292766 RepID=A0A4Y6Q0E0_PERCE|nr:PAS domain S-box protein [Persicimonas caeni]QDG54058.1 PAS domain S-box protein [Persicimonas caeni]QED35279.1 PAS domain S-box protein [Persicimonas caeni]
MDGGDDNPKEPRSRTHLRELAQARDFLTKVIEASPDAIVAAECTGDIVLFNGAAEAILGWSADEAVGMHVRNLYPPGDAERIMEMLRSQEHGGPGRLVSRREVVCSKDGRQIPVEISAGIVYEDGREKATVGIFTDLRQRLAMEERLEEATASLERTRRKALLAELAGAAAHELNQPLTSLLGYAEFVAERLAEDSTLQRPVQIIMREGQRIAEIVRKIGRITSYRTKEYVAGAKIVDLDASLFDSDPDFDPSLWLDSEQGESEEP